MKNEKDYKVICISLYDADLRRLDEVVTEMKRRGHRRASRDGAVQPGPRAEGDVNDE